MDYGQLRAEYIAAFDRMRRADLELRSMGQRLSPDGKAEQAAWQRYDLAVGAYRAARGRLADYLLSPRPAREPEVRVLAYRLWEEAGQPMGREEEHWSRAEEMVRSGQ